MDLYDNAENVGRLLFKRLIENNPAIKDYKFSTDKFKEYDCEIIDIYDKRYLIEIKYRKKYSSDTPLILNQGLMIEKMKYDKLFNNTDARHIYVMIFNDNVGYVCDLDMVGDIKWNNNYNCPRSTVENKGRYNKITGCIPINKCKRVVIV